MVWQCDVDGASSEFYAAAQPGARSGRFVWSLDKDESGSEGIVSSETIEKINKTGRLEMVIGGDCGHRWQYRFKQMQWKFKPLDGIPEGHRCKFFDECRSWELDRQASDHLHGAVALPVVSVWFENGELYGAMKEFRLENSQLESYLAERIKKLKIDLGFIKQASNLDRISLYQLLKEHIHLMKLNEQLLVGSESLLQLERNRVNLENRAKIHVKIQSRKKGIQILTRLEHALSRLVQGPAYDRFLADQIKKLSRKRDQLKLVAKLNLDFSEFRELYAARAYLDVLAEAVGSTEDIVDQSKELETKISERFEKYEKWALNQSKSLGQAFLAFENGFQTLKQFQDSEELQGFSAKLVSWLIPLEVWLNRLSQMQAPVDELRKRIDHHLKGLRSWGYGFSEDKKGLIKVSGSWHQGYADAQEFWEQLCKKLGFEVSTDLAGLCEIAVANAELKAVDTQLTNLVVEKERRNEIYKELIEMIVEWYAHTKSGKDQKFEQFTGVYNEAQNLVRHLPDKIRTLSIEEKEQTRATFCEKLESSVIETVNKNDKKLEQCFLKLWGSSHKKLNSLDIKHLSLLLEYLEQEIFICFGKPAPLSLERFEFLNSPWVVWQTHIENSNFPGDFTEKLWSFLNQLDKKRLRKGVSQQLQLIVPENQSYAMEFQLLGAGVLKPYLPKNRAPSAQARLSRQQNLVSQGESAMLSSMQSVFEEQVKREFEGQESLEPRVRSTLEILNGKNFPSKSIDRV